MAEVNLEQLKKEAAKKKDAEMSTTTIRVGDKTYFKGKVIDAVFENYDECVNANQNAQRQIDYKARGLNEFGQTPEQVRRAEKIRGLVKQREKLELQIADINIKIGLVRRDAEVVSAPQDKKKRGRKKK